MWLVTAPGMSSPCVRAWGVSTLDYESLCRTLAQSATWRGKSLLHASWKRVCKTAPWIPHLSGAMCEPSTADRGVESWIASLRESHARETAWPESDSSTPTHGTCGPTPSASFAKWSLDGSFWRTSTDSLFREMDEQPQRLGYSETWPTTGGMRSGVCFLRPAWEHPTSANDSSSWLTPCGMAGTDATGKMGLGGEFAKQATRWPTPDANVFQDGMDCTPEEWAERRQRLKEAAGNGNGCGTPLAMASQLWMTPNVPNGGRTMSEEDVLAKGQTATGKRQVPLESQAQTWATPTSRDWRDGAMEAANVPTAGLLGRQVCRSSLLGPVTETPGGASLTSTPNSPRRRRLNCLFVEWLMNFPLGWTGFAPVAMGSWLCAVRSRFASFTGDCREAD